MNARRNFLKNTGLAGLTMMTGYSIPGLSSHQLNSSNSMIDAKTYDFTQWHNRKMKKDWDLALQILQPTKRDLEYGSSLDRESLMFDTYGFMPRFMTETK